MNPFRAFISIVDRLLRPEDYVKAHAVVPYYRPNGPPVLLSPPETGRIPYRVFRLGPSDDPYQVIASLMTRGACDVILTFHIAEDGTYAFVLVPEGTEMEGEDGTEDLVARICGASRGLVVDV